jgi:hypothetical protein
MQQNPELVDHLLCLGEERIKFTQSQSQQVVLHSVNFGDLIHSQ